MQRSSRYPFLYCTHHSISDITWINLQQDIPSEVFLPLLFSFNISALDTFATNLLAFIVYVTEVWGMLCAIIEYYRNKV